MSTMRSLTGGSASLPDAFGQTGSRFGKSCSVPGEPLLARSSHQRLVSDDSGDRKTDFSLDSVEKMKVLGGEQLGKGGKNVPQLLKANFSLVAGCVTKIVGAGCGSTAQCRPSGGEQRFPRIGVAVADPDSARGH